VSSGTPFRVRTDGESRQGARWVRKCAEFGKETPSPSARRAARPVLSELARYSTEQEEWLPELGSNQRPTD